MNTTLRRIIVMMFTFLVVFGSAASCNFFEGSTNAPELKFGILKSDPKVLQNKFAFVNAVKNFKENLNINGLSGESGVSLQQLDKENLVFIAKNKGLFRSSNSGIDWKRVYVYPITDPSNPNNKKQWDADIAKNDELKITNASFLNKDTFYVSGVKNELSYLFKTVDGGNTFIEVYNTEANGKKVYIEQLQVDINSNRPNTVYLATSGGSLIRSDDAGANWKNISIPNVVNDRPLQMGYLNQYNNRLFVLYSNNGLFLSENGETFTKKQLNFGKGNNGFDNGFIFSGSTQIDKVVQARGSQDIAVVADKTVYLGTNLESEFRPLKLPIEPDKIRISDVAIDPREGVKRLLLSVDNKLFESKDSGVSWSVNDKINQDKVSLGNIGTIIIDPEDTQVVYLMLIDPNLSREEFGNFFDLGL
ncbi:MAG: WD40/YVTN/BNR-like repeat-containing protein [Patescibacteria group bacterium]